MVILSKSVPTEKEVREIAINNSFEAMIKGLVINSTTKVYLVRGDDCDSRCTSSIAVFDDLWHGTDARVMSIHNIDRYFTVMKSHPLLDLVKWKLSGTSSAKIRSIDLDDAIEDICSQAGINPVFIQCYLDPDYHFAELVGGEYPIVKGKGALELYEEFLKSSSPMPSQST